MGLKKGLPRFVAKNTHSEEESSEYLLSRVSANQHTILRVGGHDLLLFSGRATELPS